MSVYFAQVGRYIKVGYSKHPERRVKNLLQSGTRYVLPGDCPLDAHRELIAVAPGGTTEEYLCHVALADFSAGCEFFIDEPPVRAFITDAQAGRFPKVVRVGGAFVPFDPTTNEERALLQHTLDHMFDFLGPDFTFERA